MHKRTQITVFKMPVRHWPCSQNSRKKYFLLISVAKVLSECRVKVEQAKYTLAYLHDADLSAAWNDSGRGLHDFHLRKPKVLLLGLGDGWLLG